MKKVRGWVTVFIPACHAKPPTQTVPPYFCSVIMWNDVKEGDVTTKPVQPSVGITLIALHSKVFIYLFIYYFIYLLAQRPERKNLPVLHHAWFFCAAELQACASGTLRVAGLCGCWQEHLWNWNILSEGNLTPSVTADKIWGFLFCCGFLSCIRPLTLERRFCIWYVWPFTTYSV